MHLSGILITEQGRCLTHAVWQITVRFLTSLVYIILEWAGHWTECKDVITGNAVAFLIFIILTENEHTLFVMSPVIGNLVQIRLRH